MNTRVPSLPRVPRRWVLFVLFTKFGARRRIRSSSCDVACHAGKLTVAKGRGSLYKATITLALCPLKSDGSVPRNSRTLHTYRKYQIELQNGTAKYGRDN